MADNNDIAVICTECSEDLSGSVIHNLDCGQPIVAQKVLGKPGLENGKDLAAVMNYCPQCGVELSVETKRRIETAGDLYAAAKATQSADKLASQYPADGHVH